MLEAIKDLIAIELGLIFGQNLFINYYPDTPNTLVSIIDSGGFPPKLYEPTREKVVGIKIRSSNYQEGSVIGEKIFNLFHGKENYNLGNKRVLHSYAFTELSYLYADSRERDEFSFELAFLIQK